MCICRGCNFVFNSSFSFKNIKYGPEYDNRQDCPLFSEYAIHKAFACSGFKVLGVKKVFYNQYLWVEAEPANKESQAETVGFECIASLSEAYAIEDAVRIKSWKERLVRLNRDGKVALWGAGAKGITFAKLIDPGCEIIDSVVDINKNKQGRFVAGNGHPIIAYKNLKRTLEILY